MSFVPAQIIENHFLASLPGDEFEHLKPHLEPVQLAADQTLYHPGDAIEQVYFPQTCVLSAVAIMNDGATVEVSMMGKETVVGIITIFGQCEARNWHRVLIPGTALKIRSETLRELFAARYVLQPLLMRVYRSLISQISQRAVCNGRHTILERFSTWLLMVHDRVEGDDLRLTQERISHRLGSRRAGITQAAHLLHQMGAISYARGQIHIDNREMLESVACECYQVQRSVFAGVATYPKAHL